MRTRAIGEPASNGAAIVNSGRQSVLRSGIVQIYKTAIAVAFEAVRAFTCVQIPSYDAVVLVDPSQRCSQHRFRMNDGSEGRTSQHESLCQGGIRLAGIHADIYTVVIPVSEICGS